MKLTRKHISHTHLSRIFPEKKHWLNSTIRALKAVALDEIFDGYVIVSATGGFEVPFSKAGLPNLPAIHL